MAINKTLCSIFCNNMDKFAALQAFTAVVESGGFQAATQRLGIDKSVISRRISELEKSLNSRLLNRTTRRISVTDEGRQFYQRAVQILSDLEDAELATSSHSREIRGRIKIAAPLSFGVEHLSKATNEFLIQHPAIEIELDLNDRNINLVEDGFDMAVRIGELEDSTLIARKLGLSRSVTCASSVYLEKYGQPETPRDLNHHIGLQYSNITYTQQWQYQGTEGKPIQGQPQVRMRSNNGEVLADAAANGLGIISAPTFILSKYIQSGRLIPVLQDYQKSAVGIYAVYPPGRLTPLRVKAFSDHLDICFSDTPEWDKPLTS